MVRRPLASAAVAVVAGLVLSGCSTFTDASVAARVEDQTLPEDQLAEMMREAIGDEAATTAPTALSTEILNTFILDQIVRADLAAVGASIPEPATDDTLAALNVAAGNSFAAWQATPPSPVPPEVLRAEYERGPVESDIVCSRHILVDTEAEADDVLERLAAGEAFADVAAEVSTDAGSGANGGSLGCMATSQFAQAFVPEFVRPALEAEVGVPAGPAESQFGFHVIELTPFDELTTEDLAPVLAAPTVRLEFVSRQLDIWVDPRFGAFEGAFGVVPLGPPVGG